MVGVYFVYRHACITAVDQCIDGMKGPGATPEVLSV